MKLASSAYYLYHQLVPTLFLSSTLLLLLLLTTLSSLLSSSLAAAATVTNSAATSTTIAELDLSAVTPYAILENGTITTNYSSNGGSGGVAKQLNGVNSVIGGNVNESSILSSSSSTQALNSLLNSIRASMLVNQDDTIEAIDVDDNENEKTINKSDNSGNSVTTATKNTESKQVLQNPKQIPILLTTKSRPSVVKMNGTLMTVPNVPVVSTVMNVLDLVSMYKDPSFSRGSGPSSSVSSAAAASHLGKYFIFCLFFSDYFID